MKRILVVDDDTNFLKVIVFALAKEGYDVSECTSGEAAIDLINSDSYSAVISDYRLRGVSGLAVVRAARKKKPPIPTFLLTAYAGSLYGSTWGNLPEKVFPKPVDIGKLIEAIEGLDKSIHKSKKEVKMQVKDPVCGMEIDSEKAEGRHEHGGKTYYFCSQGCLDKFKADPTKFVAKQEEHHQSK